jgi:hypothetical protein
VNPSEPNAIPAARNTIDTVLPIIEIDTTPQRPTFQL